MKIKKIVKRIHKSVILPLTMCVVVLASCGQDQTAINQVTSTHQPNRATESGELSQIQAVELPPMPESGTLKISTIYSERYLDAAIEQFKTLYPNWIVEVKEYGTKVIEKTGENSVSAYMDHDAEVKYVTELSAELMSGNGPDVISMGNAGSGELPRVAFAKANVLEDLYALINADDTIDINHFQTNVLKGMEYKERLYVMPISFQVSGLKALSKEMPSEIPDDKNWTFDEMVAYFKPIMETEGIDSVFDTSGWNTFAYMLGSNYHYIVDEDNNTCDFTGELFMKILNTCKKLQDDGLVYADYNEQQPISLTWMSLIHQYISDYNKLKNEPWKEQYYRVPNIGNVEGLSFMNRLSYSINANTKEKRAAWEFMKCLVSDEMQVFPEMFGYPINTNVSEQSARQTLLDIELELTDEEFKTYMVDRTLFLAEINRVVEENSDIYNMAVEEALSFFNGKATAEEVAVKIQEKVSIYLSEQS